MLQIDLYKNHDENSRYFGKVYGRAKNMEPIGLEGLAKHMVTHNFSYSEGQLCGILKDMAKCIKHLVLSGQPVKIDDLVIFKASVRSKPAVSVDLFDISTNVKGVRLQCTPTGAVANKKLTSAAREEGIGYTSLAQRIKNGEVELSDTKGEYLSRATGNDGPSGNDEP